MSTVEKNGTDQDGPPTKKAKTVDDSGAGDFEDSKDFDADTQKALEEIDKCQNDIDALNEKASEEILKVEQKFNKLRKPYFESRNKIIAKIPNFWVTAFANHPQVSALLDEEEEECLHFMTDLEVEEFEDIKSGYRIKLHFSKNPYFTNEVITKEFRLGSSDPKSESTEIKWCEGRDLAASARARVAKQKQGRRRGVQTSFFLWLQDHTDPAQDDIADVIKDDIWPNPLQYFLVPDLDDTEHDDGDEEEVDESVVVMEEEEEDDEGDVEEEDEEGLQEEEDEEGEEGEEE